MDTHHRVTAILHIVSGLLGLGLILVCFLFVSGVAVFGAHGGERGAIFGIGTLFLGLLALPVLADVIAGFAFLRGSANARIVLIVFGALGLFAFPYGTLIGAYTLWALLRKLPAAEAPVPFAAPAAVPAAVPVDLSK